MPKMDPNFAAAFSSEFPEAYDEALKAKRKRGAEIVEDDALAVHVPVIPPLLSKLVAFGVLIALGVGGYFLLTDTFGVHGAGLPSGTTMSDRSGFDPSGSKAAQDIGQISDPNSGLGEKVAPIGNAGKDFLKKWTR